VVFVSVMKASDRLPKNFLDMTQVHLATRFRILKRVCKQPHTPTPSPKLGIALCSLAIYKPTPIPATSAPLCILNLAFHTKASILK
jgi:hypothetical protein